jgi:hypothetical protein
MSDTADHGNPHFSVNPFAEFLTTFLQVRSCMDTIRRRSAISGQQQMSLSDTLAFETARHVREEAKSLADRDLQVAVMQAVMACGSTCSAAWNSVGGVRMHRVFRAIAKPICRWCEPGPGEGPVGRGAGDGERAARNSSTHGRPDGRSVAGGFGAVQSSDCRSLGNGGWAGEFSHAPRLIGRATTSGTKPPFLAAA